MGNINLLKSTFFASIARDNTPFTGRKLPSRASSPTIKSFPDNFRGKFFANILKAIGAKPIYYPEKLDCCGGLLTANLPESALTKTGQKLQRVQEQGFDIFIDVCPWCHRQYDAKQTKAGETVAAKLDLPVLYLTQLLGMAIGISKDKLGFDLNQSPIEKINLEG